MSESYWELQSNAPVHEGDTKLDDGIAARKSPIAILRLHSP